MTKKGPLGTAEVFYVKGHYKEKTVQEIAKDLDRPLVTIQKHVDTCTGQEPNLGITAGSSMARREGIVLMTETASAIGDEHKSRIKKAEAKRNPCVTQIKDD